VWEQSYDTRDRRWLAYALATAYHEAAFTMQPIHEKGGPKYFFSMYDKDGDRPKVAKALGNTEKGDGVRFHGRGYVQLTGRTNYAKAKKLVGADLVNNPDLALDPAIASMILEWKRASSPEKNSAAISTIRRRTGSTRAAS
jgi:putative chitinase